LLMQSLVFRSPRQRLDRNFRFDRRLIGPSAFRQARPSA
jgi:hypothetical protein